MDVAKALAVFMPLVRALILEAEGAGGTGKEKHDAVAGASEALYLSLQNSVKELRDVPWAAIAPLIVTPASGLIDIVVGLLNTLWGKVWNFLKDLAD